MTEALAPDRVESLFARLCRKPSDPVLLSQLLALNDRHDSELDVYFAREDATCRQAMTALFAQPSTPADRVARLARAQVCARHQLHEGISIDGPLLGALATDQLFLLVLSESLNSDVGFERICIRLRRGCLVEDGIDAAIQPLLAALALQAWNNEYVWEETGEETAAIDRLGTRLDLAVEEDDLAGAAWPLLRWAMYRPLGALAAVNALLTRAPAAIPPVVRPLWQRTLLAPQEEALLRAAMPRLQICDATSRLVQAHYEQNPYPRWLRLTGPKKPLLARNRTYDASFSWPATFRPPLQILVAGCGTGRDPLDLAAANPEDEVFAIDLSASSLAYGQRMARELGISNIRFMQADLLDLPAWGRQFHHIRCIGVLHQLGDQQAAWRSLSAALYPGGTLAVGVYSKVATLAMKALRAWITRAGVSSAANDVRAARARLLREPQPAVLSRHRVVADFFSLSTVRHLFFDVCEHTYTVRELEQRVTECGLQLMGYRLPPSMRGRIVVPGGQPTFAQWRTLEEAYMGSMGMLMCTLRREDAMTTAGVERI